MPVSLTEPEQGRTVEQREKLQPVAGNLDPRAGFPLVIEHQLQGGPAKESNSMVNYSSRMDQ